MCLNYKISSRCTAEIHNHEINQRMHIVLVVYGKCYCVDVKQHYRAQNSENLQYRFKKLEYLLCSGLLVVVLSSFTVI